MTAYPFGAKLFSMKNELNVAISQPLVNTFLYTLGKYTGEGFKFQDANYTKDGLIRNFKRDYVLGNKKNCPFNMPICYTENKQPQKDKKEKNWEEIYPAFFRCARAGKIPNGLLQGVCLDLIQKIPHIFIHNDKYSIQTIEGRDVFATSYNRSLEKTLKHVCTKLDKDYKYSAFVTLTYDVKKYGSDIINGWEQWKELLDKYFEAMRHKYECRYVVVNEATLKGYPHAHILFYSNKPFGADWEKLPFNKKIYHSEFHSFVAKRSISKIFAIKKPYSTGTKNYLAKYITKTTTGALAKIADPQNPLSDENKKMLQSILLPKFAGLHRVRRPKGEDITEYLNACRIDDRMKYLESKEKKLRKRVEEIATDYTMTAEEQTSIRRAHRKVWELLHPETRAPKKEVVSSFVVKEDFESTFPTETEIDKYLADDSRRQAFLIKLCTKVVEAHCGKPMVMGDYAVKQSVDEIQNQKLMSNDVLFGALKRQCTPLGCGGCIVKHFCNYILTGKDEWFCSPYPSAFVQVLRGQTTNDAQGELDAVFNGEVERAPRGWLEKMRGQSRSKREAV